MAGAEATTARDTRLTLEPRMLDIQQSLGTWIPQVQGQYINMDWNPQNKGFGAQCWDTAAHWSAFLGLPIINTGGSGRWPGWAGNMVDAFPQTPTIAAAYTLHGPNETGQPGDIAVWGDSYWWYPKTHVAVLVLDKGSWLTCMSQNSTPSRADNPYPGDSSGPTTIQSLPRQGLIGLIRPNVGGLAAQGTITPVQEDEMPITQKDAELIADTLLGRQWQAKPNAVLGELLNEYRSHHLTIAGKVESVAKDVMTYTVDGVAGDRLNLDQFLREYRSHVIQDQAASAAIIAAKAAAGGASIEEIRKAVHEALASGITVEATVKVVE